MNIRSIDYSTFDVWPEFDEQAAIHDRYLFCWDMTCPCRHDYDRITALHQAYQDGLITSDEQALIYCGRMV